MGIHAHEERAADLFCFSVFADGLADGQDVSLVEAVPEG
jgi:hypothetical protein